MPPDPIIKKKLYGLKGKSIFMKNKTKSKQSSMCPYADHGKKEYKFSVRKTIIIKNKTKSKQSTMSSCPIIKNNNY